MAKPVINYKGYMTVNPGDRSGDKICIPQIVDRNQVKTLESIVEEAIDRGLIAGLKASAAAGVAQGIMIQLGQTLNGGTGIIFGDYFAVRPYRSRTCSRPSRRRTSCASASCRAARTSWTRGTSRSTT